jgi:hypothetical protein
MLFITCIRPVFAFRICFDRCQFERGASETSSDTDRKLSHTWRDSTERKLDMTRIHTHAHTHTHTRARTHTHAYVQKEFLTARHTLARSRGGEGGGGGGDVIDRAGNSDAINIAILRDFGHRKSLARLSFSRPFFFSLFLFFFFGSLVTSARTQSRARARANHQAARVCGGK